MKKSFLKVLALTLVLVFAFSPSVMASNSTGSASIKTCCNGCVDNVELVKVPGYVEEVNNEVAPRGCGHHIWRRTGQIERVGPVGSSSACTFSSHPSWCRVFTMRGYEIAVCTNWPCTATTRFQVQWLEHQ